MQRPALDPGRVDRILVCQLRQIGDVLLATPAIGLLKARFPGAELHVLTETKCAPMLELNPDVDRVWAIDKKALPNLFREVAYYWRVARQGFDLVVDFQQLPRCRWVVGFSRARLRLSHTAPWYNRWLYTHTVEPEHGYAAKTKASVLAPLGIRWQGEAPRLVLAPEELAWADAFLARHGLEPEDKLVTVDPSHRRPTRCWPADYFGRTLGLALEADPGLRFLLLYGPGEEGVARAVADAAGAGGRCILPDSMLTLRQSAACIARAALHFGNCSAPRHMAVAVGTPSLTIMGATGWAWTFESPEHQEAALDLECRPCNRNECPDPRCLTDLKPEAVAPRLPAMAGERRG